MSRRHRTECPSAEADFVIVVLDGPGYGDEALLVWARYRLFASAELLRQVGTLIRCPREAVAPLEDT